MSKHYFWRRVERTAAECLQQIFAKNVGEAKVGYFRSAVFVEQNVFQLEISVADVVLKKCGVKSLLLLWRRVGDTRVIEHHWQLRRAQCSVG